MGEKECTKMGPPPPPQEEAVEVDHLFAKDVLLDGTRDDTIGLIVDPRASRYDWVPYAKVSWNPQRVMSVILLTGWTVMLWLGWLVKRVINEENEYSHYLTNCTWSLVTIYQTFKLLGYLEAAVCTRSMRRERILYWTYYILFWPTLVTVWAVTWLVLIVLERAPELLTDEFEVVGVGNTLLGNFVYHVAPLVIFFIDGNLTIHDHMYMLWRTNKSLMRFIGLQIVLAHCLPVFYAANYDFHVIYQVPSVPYWFIILTFEALLMAVVVLIMIPLSPWGLMNRVGFYAPLPARDPYKED